MFEDIKNRLNQFIIQEQAFLSQISKLKTQRIDTGTELTKDLISEGVGIIAKDFFESSLAKKLGKKVTRSYLDKQQRGQLLTQVEWLENRHNSLIQSVKTFLSSISLKSRNLKEPNSSKLIEKIDRAQEYVKVETRIKRTILALKGIMSKSLIYNKDIPDKEIEKEVIISPGKPFTGLLKLKEILGSSKDYVKIIDPYVDASTLDFLLTIPKKIKIQLLTVNTGGKEKERRLKRVSKMFKTERPSFELRKCEPGLIHDRFVLTQTQGWNIGSSLKDIGKKLSMITEISTETKRNIEKKFNEIWKRSNNLLA